MDKCTGDKENWYSKCPMAVSRLKSGEARMRSLPDAESGLVQLRAALRSGSGGCWILLDPFSVQLSGGYWCWWSVCLLNKRSLLQPLKIDKTLVIQATCGWPVDSNLGTPPSKSSSLGHLALTRINLALAF